ncbi:MAG: glutamate--tRNA ligase [PVC group bacterium]|nr:glutamate--tRNA ligase [PVC group bacterium]
MPVVRFAPSPTGYLHVGGARTCLFNWLYARSTGSKFILRIEDTDLTRSKKEYLDEILDSLKWMGLDWDELYHQSERFDLYREHAQKLLEEGKAYKDGEAIIYKVKDDTAIRFFDVLHGEIKIEADHIKDQVLLKSDGSPAYNFCCVVDDASMGLTHIIRGDDHIANTPKQILIYEALGFKVPKFVHIPMILGEDKSRLSKRHGATAISDYRKQGVLPEALVNYLALLGWNPGTERELFTLPELVKTFSLKRVNKTAAVFDNEKLGWVNGEYIKKLDSDKLVALLLPLLKDKGYIDDNIDQPWLIGLVNLYKTRFNNLNRFVELTGFFFNDEIEYDQESEQKYLVPEITDALEAFKNKLITADTFDVSTIETTTRALVEELNIKSGELIHPLRVALTGGTVSPGIFEVIYYLGKDKVIMRLDKVITKLRAV